VVVLYNCALPVNGPLRPETFRVWMLKHYYNSDEMYAFVGHIVTSDER